MVELSITPRKEHSIRVKVVGERYENDDGSSRQEIIKNCQVGEEIDLVPNPDNPYDKNAIEVRRMSGEQIGHLPRKFVSKLLNTIRDNPLITAYIDKIKTRQSFDGERYLSCELSVYLEKAGEPYPFQYHPEKEFEKGNQYPVPPERKLTPYYATIAIISFILLMAICSRL